MTLNTILMLPVVIAWFAGLGWALFVGIMNVFANNQQHRR